MHTLPRLANILARTRPKRIFGICVHHHNVHSNKGFRASRKANLPQTLGQHCPDSCSHLLFVIFLRCPWTASIAIFNSAQTRCIVKGEAQKSPLFWQFSGGFWFSQDRLFSRNSTRKPLNLINPWFLQTPLVKPLVFTMRLVCTL